MRRGVCDDVTTGGGAAFAIGSGIQMERHLLRDKSVKVHIVQAIPAAAQGLSGVSGGTRGPGAHRDTGHSTTETMQRNGLPERL